MSKSSLYPASQVTYHAVTTWEYFKILNINRRPLLAPSELPATHCIPQEYVLFQPYNKYFID